MRSTTFTVRVGSADKRRLERLAKSTGRSRSFLAAEAIKEYLEVNEWQVAGIRSAIASLHRGQGVGHAQVKQWVASWGSRRERPRPKPSRGRAGRVPGTRELIIPRTPFIVPYRLEGKTIQILRIFHGAR